MATRGIHDLSVLPTPTALTAYSIWCRRLAPHNHGPTDGTTALLSNRGKESSRGGECVSEESSDFAVGGVVPSVTASSPGASAYGSDNGISLHPDYWERD